MLYAMSNNTVFKGPEVTLEGMMAAREVRSLKQKQLLEKYEGKSLLCATMNIPGPVKTSPDLNQAFEEIIKTVKNQVGKSNFVFEKLLPLDTGWEYYLVSCLPFKELKREMIGIETKNPAGRLMDLDVLSFKDGYIQPISRQDLGFPARQCYICQNDAKVCGRSCRHSIEEMQLAIIEILKQNKKEKGG